MSNTKLVVYTALFGNYDNLIEPKEKFTGCDFICFTDQKNLKSKIWEIRLIENYDLVPNLMNRKYKIFPNLFLEEYEKSLYVDANVYIKKNPFILSTKYLDDYNIAIPKHVLRNCIYKEADVIVKSNKVPLKLVRTQIQKYQNNGFPENFGLTENNIIFRKHKNLEIVQLMNAWWHELNIYTQRDQLSLMYVVWKYNIALKMISENARGGKYFRLKLHQHEKIEKCFLYNFVLEIFHNHPNLHKIPYALRILKKICIRLYE